MASINSLFFIIALVYIVNASERFPNNATIVRKPLTEIMEKYRDRLGNATKEVETSVQHGMNAVIEVVKNGLQTKIDIIKNIQNSEALMVNALLNRTAEAIDTFGQNVTMNVVEPAAHN